MKKNTIAYIGIAVMSVAIIVILIVGLTAKKEDGMPGETASSATAATKENKPGVIEIKHEVTAEIIKEGLRDMGRLVTEEYMYTGVVSSKTTAKFFDWFDIPFTESSFMASYDGTVEAGIDFEKVRIEKDKENKQIHVGMPEPEIQFVTIDKDSFKLYSEKNGIGTKISAKDFNDSLKELEETAKEKAIANGILKKADTNAKKMIRNFITGVLDEEGYVVLFDLPAEEEEK